MNGESPELKAARNFTAQAAAMLEYAPSFQKLHPSVQTAITRDLGKINQALNTSDGAQTSKMEGDPYALRLNPVASPPLPAAPADPYALALDSPGNYLQRRMQAGRGASSDNQPASKIDPAQNNEGATNAGPKVAATESLARRAGALSDEINFPSFVAGLIHGTFDAMVDATIRQMEAFAELVSAVAKDVDQFTSDNITTNQVRDWLVQQHPNDIYLEVPHSGPPRLRVRQHGDEAESNPAWLIDYGLEGPLTDELLEGTLTEIARRQVGENRLRVLAGMVLMGMNRIVIKDGTISARVRFRAAANDKAAVNYAVTQDPTQQTWGERGSRASTQFSTMVSTVGVNVQAETDLKAELFGEVRINFASETLPLDQFVDSARMTLLQRNAHRPALPPASLPASAAPTPTPPSVVAPPTPGPSPAPDTGTIRGNK